MSPDDFRESAALYAAGALDPVTARRFERYLRTASADERREVRELVETASLLPLALPESAVPSYLRSLLLTEITRDTSHRRILTPRPAPSDLSATRRLLIAATVILALGCGFLFWQNRQLAAERNRLTAELNSNTQQLAAARQQLEEIVSPATRVISLSGEAASQASAKMIWDTRQQQLIIYLYNLPAQPADRDYQLWYLTSDQRRISAAVFRTDAQGRGEVRLSVPASIAPLLTAAAVSLEPKGGSPQPTGRIFLKGEV